VVVVVVAVAFGVAQLVGGQGGGHAASARPVAGELGSPSPSSSSGSGSGSTVASSPSPGGLSTAGPSGSAPAGDKKSREVLATPTGPCVPRDVRVSPGVRGTAYAGSDVTFVLELTTRRTPACTWEVSPTSVVLRLTSGSDPVWSTQYCPASVETRSVVVRRDHPAKAYVTWNGQRSDADCSTTTPWAHVGYYYAEAAAYGGDPTSAQFQLLSPVAATITASPTPDPSASPTPDPSASPSSRPSASPSADSSAPAAARHPAKKSDSRR
jgi:hypothetical protein